MVLSEDSQNDSEDTTGQEGMIKMSRNFLCNTQLLLTSIIQNELVS